MLEIISFVTLSAFFICDAMEQMADEITVADAERKRRGSAAEESPVWVREGKDSKMDLVLCLVFV